jgi:hypothetical protein
VFRVPRHEIVGTWDNGMNDGMLEYWVKRNFLDFRAANSAVVATATMAKSAPRYIKSRSDFIKG